VGTALFYDPLVCPKINAGIAEYLAANRMPNVQALVGRLEDPARALDPDYC
jgi:dihydroorotate dehydrogenase (NAD+) catalytic subunit